MARINKTSRVQIETMMGKTVEFQVRRGCLLMELKLKIMLEMGIFPEDMVLIFHNNELKDEDKSLEEYGIGLGEDMDTIFLMIKTSTGLMGWSYVLITNQKS